MFIRALHPLFICHLFPSSADQWDFTLARSGRLCFVCLLLPCHPSKQTHAAHTAWCIHRAHTDYHPYKCTKKVRGFSWHCKSAPVMCSDSTRCQLQNELHLFSSTQGAMHERMRPDSGMAPQSQGCGLAWQMQHSPSAKSAVGFYPGFVAVFKLR